MGIFFSALNHTFLHMVHKNTYSTVSNLASTVHSLHKVTTEESLPVESASVHPADVPIHICGETSCAA